MHHTGRGNCRSGCIDRPRGYGWVVPFRTASITAALLCWTGSTTTWSRMKRRAYPPRIPHCQICLSRRLWHSTFRAETGQDVGRWYLSPQATYSQTDPIWVRLPIRLIMTAFFGTWSTENHIYIVYRPWRAPQGRRRSSKNQRESGIRDGEGQDILLHDGHHDITLLTHDRNGPLYTQPYTGREGWFLEDGMTTFQYGVP